MLKTDTPSEKGPALETHVEPQFSDGEVKDSNPGSGSGSVVGATVRKPPFFRSTLFQILVVGLCAVRCHASLIVCTE